MRRENLSTRIYISEVFILNIIDINIWESKLLDKINNMELEIDVEMCHCYLIGLG